MTKLVSEVDTSLIQTCLNIPVEFHKGGFLKRGFQQQEILRDGVKTYFVHGPFFFTSANRFLKILNADSDPEKVEVVFNETTSLFDYSAMQAMNKISAEYKSKGKQLLAASRF